MKRAAVGSFFYVYRLHFRNFRISWEEVREFQKGVNSVESEKVTHISAKLNPEIDMDLIKDIKKIPKRLRSHVYREALKLYFKQDADGNRLG